MPQRFKNSQESCGANIASVGWEIEQHNRYVAVFAFAALQSHHLADTCRQHDGALWARVHVLCACAFTKSTGMVTTSACHTGRTRTSTKNHRAGRTIKLRNRHHDGAFNGQQTAVRTTPLVQGLKFNGVCCNIRHIQFCQNLFRSFGVVVCGAPHQ